ncbi:TPA: hypothetical protein DIC40_03390 [Patescibacteria group bacterium]|nr:hypothetical protein P148_SR1C00001G0416 [candidate division SR1 bacterium RAAC1_SR1_1]HCY20886.1 hypothetical protein [Candidatus Gracilibacteria bacterium]
MGNYASRQAQLESETKNIFDRLMNKNTIEKSDVMSLVNKFKALKEENPAQYVTIANKAIGLNNNFKKLALKGRVNPKGWEKLNSIYEEFKSFVEAKELA